ncbi:FtsX-like permease family protein [Micromonospora sp. M12]
MAALFVVMSVYLTALIVGLTMTSSIARQGRDIALVRAVGATPGQVRRAVAAQAAAVAVPAAVLGCRSVPCSPAPGWRAHRARGDPARRDVPQFGRGAARRVGHHRRGVAAWCAGRRDATRTGTPAAALTETAVPRRQVGFVRTAIGVVLVAGGVLLSMRVANGDPAKAGESSFFTMLAMCIGAASSVRSCCGWPPAGATVRGTGALAADNLAVRSRRCPAPWYRWSSRSRSPW